MPYNKEDLIKVLETVPGNPEIVYRDGAWVIPINYVSFKVVTDKTSYIELRNKDE